MIRIEIRLSKDENREFRRLKPVPNVAFTFWERVAKLRDLDPGSIVWTDGKLTGLPLRHNQHWCYPVPLKCKVDPATVEI